MTENPSYKKSLPQDLAAGLVVFLVALPLCLGVALASGAPIVSGIVAGVVGGVLVTWISGSHTSVSGPAAGLTAIVATQVEQLGSFEAFLVAVVLAGLFQIGLGALRAGSLAAFFPSSVIKGLLSAIGIILILKQIPHLFGNDDDWLGDMSFRQLDGGDTFAELFQTLANVHPGATLIGLSSLVLLVLWDRTPLKRLVVPAPLVVVIGGIAMAVGLEGLGEPWSVGGVHLVQVPVADSFANLFGSLHAPDFSALAQPAIAVAAVTVALVASLETLLNLEAVDKLDPERRASPPNRELVAQGVGNVTSGLLGGLPITSVVVRSSVGIDAGGKTRVASFVHGVMLLVSVLLLPGMLNRIPLACLAAVLMVTGFKLVSLAVFRQMWGEGRSQFLPFAGTVAAIVLTDLLVGILFGLAVASLFILHANMQSPLRKISEHHVGGDVLRIELGSQMTFLNRAALLETFHQIPNGSQVILDARNTRYVDPDIHDLIREFVDEVAPAREIRPNLLGFQDRYEPKDHVTRVDVSTRDIQDRATPEQVLEILKAGNGRFVTGQPISRDPRRQVDATASGQHPLAVVLSCMDSRVATELVFDLGLGDVFAIRVAGNIVSEQALGSMEYGCAIAGAKLVLVLGHTRCGAITATVDQVAEGPGANAGDFENLSAITGPIAHAVHAETATTGERNGRNEEFVRRVTVENVRIAMGQVRGGSGTLRRLLDNGKIGLAGGVYDVVTGQVTFLDSD